MPFLAPRTSLKRKSDGTNSTSNKRQWRAQRDVEFLDVDVDNVVSTSSEIYQYWTVQWRLPQTKKHKTWDGDAVVAIASGQGGVKCTLYDTSGNILLTSKIPLTSPKPGDNFRIGDRELEIDGPISRSDFIAGVCFGRGAPGVPSTPYKPVVAPELAKKYIPVRPRSANASSSISRPTIPLQPVNLVDLSGDDGKGDPSKSQDDSHWMVNWRESSSHGKKNKSWENDGFVSFSSKKVTLYNEVGKILGESEWKGGARTQGKEFFVLGKEVRLDASVSTSSIPVFSKSLRTRNSLSVDGDDLESFVLANPRQVLKFVPPASNHPRPNNLQSKGPRHDPNAEGAIVMKAPNKPHEAKYNKKFAEVVPVVIDPLLARFLRPHQVEGVKFMYECVMGMRKHEGQGCILADEMGLGKTLQTITLIWTLLKQNPYGGNSVVGKCLIACPVTLVNNWKREFYKWIGRDRIGIFMGDKDKVVIKQFVNSKIHQVLIIGYERLKSVIADLAYCNPPIGLIICDEGHRLKSAQSKVNRMFEALKTPRRIILSGTPIQNDLGEFHAMADFCNPGLLDDYPAFKRLYETPIVKSRTPGCSSKELELGKTRAAQLLASSRSFVLRRDASTLSNYLPPKFEYVVFVRPSGIQLSMFAGILQQDALSALIKGSTARSLALISCLTKISNSPVLLRLNDGEKENGSDDSIRGSDPLREAIKLLPDGVQAHDISLSGELHIHDCHEIIDVEASEGKLLALANILKAIRKDTEEKCVIVSHYTSTLDVIQQFCEKTRYTYHRLDGHTQVGKRQEYVDSFNKSSQSKCFLFLLSAKAGGVGLNLIGASRLILVDSDWNPSHDLQAMARIHRDGQKRPVFIYRLLSTEKIYQRQVTKIGLSDSLMTNQTGDGAKFKSDSFSPQELRDLFTIHPRTLCHTHELLGCSCLRESGDPHHHSVETEDDVCDISTFDTNPWTGWVVASQLKAEDLDKTYIKKKKAELAALSEWSHVNCMLPSASDRIHDVILGSLVELQRLPVEDVVENPSNSRGERLIAALDVESILAVQEMETESGGLDFTKVSGGTLTFIFEKKAHSSL